MHAYHRIYSHAHAHPCRQCSCALSVPAGHPAASVLEGDLEEVTGFSATQISTYEEDTVASRTHDGNTSTEWSNHSCMHTDNDARPWYRADLGWGSTTRHSRYLVSQVKIWGRTDSCCKCRSQQLAVYVGDNGDVMADNVLVASGVDAASADGVTLTFQSVVGRFVWISRDFSGRDCEGQDENALNLCEVKVWDVGTCDSDWPEEECSGALDGGGDEASHHFVADCSGATAHGSRCALTVSAGYAGGSVTCNVFGTNGSATYDVVPAAGQQVGSGVCACVCMCVCALGESMRKNTFQSCAKVQCPTHH